MSARPLPTHTGSSAAAPATSAKAGVQGARSLTRRLFILFEMIGESYDRWHQRQALARLSDHQLRDIGISRSDVEEEVRKPFWRS